MLRKFNYTGRKKIPLKYISIQKLNNGFSNYFTANLTIETLGFPDEACVYIEAYFNANFIRFDFGKIKSIKSPIDTTLDELPSIEGIRFRLKIVDESESRGRILGKADNIKPTNELDDGQKESILPVKFTNLKNQIWKVEFDQDILGPVLVFNNEDNFPGIRTKIKTDPFFFSLIYPAAVRFVLNKMREEDKLDRDGDDWSSRWIQFSEDILGVTPTPSSAESPEIDNWIDEVVNNFCLKYKVLNRLNF